MKELLFSVIVPAFNQSAVLLKCLESQAAQRVLPFEVIVVDNASTDCLEDRKLPKKLNIKRLRLSENRYFAEAVNLGYAESSGDWILVLNSDVVLDRDCLSHAAQTFRNQPDLECASTVLYSKNNRVDCCGVRPGKSLRPRDINTLKNETIFGPSGAAFWIRRSLCERLIAEDKFLLDPEISFFYVDLDFAFRLKQRNIRAHLLSSAKGVHERGASTPKRKSFLPFSYCQLRQDYQALLRENRKSFLKKWGKQKQFWNLPFLWIYDGALKFMRHF